MRADERICRSLLIVTICCVLGIFSLVMPFFTRTAVAAGGENVLIIEDRPTQQHSASHAAAHHSDSHPRHSQAKKVAPAGNTGHHRNTTPHPRHSTYESTPTAGHAAPQPMTSEPVTAPAANPVPSSTHATPGKPSASHATPIGEYEAEYAELAGAATTIDATGGKAVRCLAAEGSSLTFKKVDGGIGGSVPCVISYANGGSEPATVNLKVNGASAGAVTLPPTGGWSGLYQMVTCHLNLKGGMTNNIQFVSTGQDWVCENITVHPLFPTSVQTGAISVVLSYWPLMLVLMVIGILVYLIRNGHQYYDTTGALATSMPVSVQAPGKPTNIAGPQPTNFCTISQ